MQKSTFELENQLLSEGYDFVIGIDEAGRGPLAGPVVACAVCPRNPHLSRLNHRDILFLNRERDILKWTFVRDSKMLSEKQREIMFDFVQEHFFVGVGICDHKTIDRINILEATYLAMKAAVSDLQRNLPSNSSPYQGEEKSMSFRTSRKIILIDGNKKIPNLSMEQKTVVNGDKFVKSISAASIIAKVTRDRIMREMHKKYPEYNFAKHKGYGTKLHFAMLETHGPCEIHRRSFAPVRRLVKNNIE